MPPDKLTTPADTELGLRPAAEDFAAWPFGDGVSDEVFRDDIARTIAMEAAERKAFARLAERRNSLLAFLGFSPKS